MLSGFLLFNPWSPFQLSVISNSFLLILGSSGWHSGGIMDFLQFDWKTKRHQCSQEAQGALISCFHCMWPTELHNFCLLQILFMSNNMVKEWPEFSKLVSVAWNRRLLRYYKEYQRKRKENIWIFLHVLGCFMVIALIDLAWRISSAQCLLTTSGFADQRAAHSDTQLPGQRHKVLSRISPECPRPKHDEMWSVDLGSWV